MIYLDWNATAPLRPAAYDAMQAALRDTYGNPSSVHAAGRAARVAVDEARERVAALIGAEPREIVFTSGATEANNLAILGAALRNPGCRFVSSPTEHPSVLEPLQALADGGRIDLRWLDLDDEGAVSQAAHGWLPSTETCFVSLMLANNETGRLSPVAEIAGEARRQGALVHSDLTQAVGRVAVNVDDLGVDLASLSGHKIGGPKGVGALFVRRGAGLEKVLFGGKQERSRRPGTENVPAIVGFGAAAEAALHGIGAFSARMRELRLALWELLQKLPVPPVLNTPLDESVSNTLNVSFIDQDGLFLLQQLDMAGVCVSSGAACASGSPEPSPVLSAIGYPTERVKGAVRFSLGYSSTQEEIEKAVRILEGLLGKERIENDVFTKRLAAPADK